MVDFMAAIQAPLDGIPAVVFTVGAVIIGVVSAIYAIRGIRDLMEERAYYSEANRLNRVLDDMFDD